MKSDIQNLNFPITEVIPEIQNKLAEYNTLIVSAPPGAGKSTVLPLALANETWLSGAKIIMLEPRRLAAKSIASRMSDLIGEPVGASVGYRVRFENHVSGSTRIEVVTEGILTRMLQSDNTLEGVGMVIFDEFHERSLFADVALAFCREVQQVLRSELRIVIMSATLDFPRLAALLEAPVVESPGRMYPVEIHYRTVAEEFSIAARTAAAVLDAVKEESGDTLVFLPGEGEIHQCEELLKDRLDEGFVIHPLYGQLPHNRQQAAIVPDRHGLRKIVLATSIAETSLTIEGVRIVVDSGYARTQKFNPNTSLSRLETVMISKDMADQRAGRAGRLEAGICYRLWSKATHERMAEHRVPEIEEADLTSLVLDMAVWGVTDIASMTWLTIPPNGALHRAIRLLEELEALENGKITRYGKEMHRLPCHPRIAHMLIHAKENGISGLGTDLAALLEERDPMPKEFGSDINLRIEALRRYRNNGSGASAFGRIGKAAEAYRRMATIPPDGAVTDPYRTGWLVAMAFPERIARALGHGQFQLANGNRARMDETDDLAHEEWIAIAHMDSRDGNGKIFLASPLRVEDLLPFAKESDQLTWETRKGGIIARTTFRFGGMVIKSRPLIQPDPEKVKRIICEAVKREGEQLLDFDEDTRQWQHRVLSLAKWDSEQEWPDVSTSVLLETCDEWLSPYLDRVTKADDLKKIRLKDILQFHLPYALQNQLDELAPERIPVPSGSKIKLHYFSDGAQPILAVRLQECFGLADTPRVCRERIAVLMHLLSPGFKPVQITSDLSSFWNHAYYDVKKELKSRYPKHVWPEDPWKEQAIRGTKRTGR